MKKALCLSLAAMMLLGLLAACGGDEPAAADEPTATPTATGEKEVVTFWYNNTGDEALVYEKAIEAYNASQNAYEVQGLSVNDAQKLIVAMSSNEAPDVIKISNQEVIQYQANGLLEDVQALADEEGYDFSIFSEQAMAANSVDGVAYGLPLTAYTIQLFYNKDLLEAAGYDAPPETMEELYEMAVAATVIDEGGSFEVLGYPLFPYASARQELIYAFGGRWWSEDGKTMTPEAQGNLDSLNMNVQYRDLYGSKAINEFISEANTNRYTEQDMFFQGRQLFRLDGSWLPTMMVENKSTTNWGVTLVPGTEANPGLRGTSRFETDSISIPLMATNKPGAWDFTKWLCDEEGAKIICLGNGNLPALKTLYEDADILAQPGFDAFIDALQLEKGIQYPAVGYFSEYTNLLNAALDEVYAGNQTPEEAMADLAAQVSSLA